MGGSSNYSGSRRQRPQLIDRKTKETGEDALKKLAKIYKLQAKEDSIFTTSKGSDVSLQGHKDGVPDNLISAVESMNPITTNQKSAIYNYSTDTYSGINNLLYSLDKDGLNAWEKGEYKGHLLSDIKALSNATNFSINAPMHLYRGENRQALNNMFKKMGINADYDTATDEQLKMLVGKVQEIKGFTSVAYDAKRSFHSKPIFMDIDAPKGFQGAPMIGISHFGSGEAEILSHNSGGFLYKDVYRDRHTGQIIIKAEYLHPKHR